MKSYAIGIYIGYLCTAGHLSYRLSLYYFLLKWKSLCVVTQSYMQILHCFMCVSRISVPG